MMSHLENAVELSGREVISATARVFDAIVDRKVRFRDDPGFDKAVSGAVKKPVGDMWVWSRKASANDVTPLIAACLAMGPGSVVPESEPFMLLS